jgi:hypothetical protein
MRLLRPLLIVSLAVAALAVPDTANAARPVQTRPALALPVHWAEFRGTFDGQLIVEQFTAGSTGAAGLVALGTLQGMTNSRYGPEQVNQPAAVPVLAIAVDCRTLHLELGPLDPVPPSHVGLHLDRFAADVTPAHLSRTGRRLLHQLALAIRRGAPADELAARLNVLLPELVR